MRTTRRSFVKGSLAAGTCLAIRNQAFAQVTGRLPAQAGSALTSTEFTRGIGQYPGLPSEFFGATIVPDTSGTLRNLALLRPAFHSSSYDYNLTAQLVTDGIVHNRLPDWLSVVLNGEVQPKETREVLLDHDAVKITVLSGAHPQIEVHLEGGSAETLPPVDRVEVLFALSERITPDPLQVTLWTSADGHTWDKMGTTGVGTLQNSERFPPGLLQGNSLFQPSIHMPQARQARQYRIELRNPSTDENAQYTEWRVSQIFFYHGEQRVQIGGPYSFTSAWKAAGLGREWVYVDLGTPCTFDRVALHWIAPPAEGELQVSDDAVNWRQLQPLPTSGALHDLRLSTPATGRYVRAHVTKPLSDDGYILSEFEVFGRGGLRAEPHPAAPVLPDGTLPLAGGAWRLQRAARLQAAGDGPTLSKAGYNTAGWLPATVPGTSLTSYVNAGALPDPNFGENQLYLSDSFFYADFWYRTEFTAPSLKRGEHAWLNFNGTNWKAEVFLNGESLGRIDGGFMRGRFDVTGKLHANAPNALAVRVLKNANPGSCKQKTFDTTGINGGALGLDDPTYHASVGWDWIPTIRGRDTGLWGPITLSKTGAVRIENPAVGTKLPLPNINTADVTVAVELVNAGPGAVKGTLRVKLGDLSLAQPVTLAPASRQTVTLSPATHPDLHLTNPQLWYPAGYGEPHLYDCELRFDERGHTSDLMAIKVGLRQMAATEDGGSLRLFINGRRVIAKGGNWGFGESMLLYRAREYDAAVRYHRDMHFNMIRNWVGQIGDDAFYEACDRHGVLVWQDFWLANPWDGPIPDDNALFLANARDTLLRIRHHGSLGIYCGRNEGFPPAALEAGLRKLLAELHPDLPYIGSSADGPVSGHGPYHALPTPEYFRIADTKLHSEIGSPAIPSMESLRLMMPEHALWPQGLDWGLHDFTIHGAQGASNFLAILQDSYGGAESAEEFVALAQFLNFDTYRAMFESQSRYRMGLLLWMSHPCWPSFVWQTYDYYLEPTSAYYGSKLGSEPIHIQWNPVDDTIEVVNYSAGDLQGITATAEILNFDGSSQWKRSATLDAKEDSVAAPIPMQYPAGLSAVHFLRLTLTQAGTLNDKPLSTNFYLRGREEGNFRAIRTMGQATLTARTTAARNGNGWLLTTQITNTSAIPALMVRAQAIRATTGDRILPALYSENYFALMPNETRTLTVEFQHADTRNEPPALTLEAFNVKPTRSSEQSTP